MTVLERVDQVTREAKQARPGVAVATALAWLLINAGWLAARALSGLWLTTAWCAIAVREGWREGRSPEWAAHVERRQTQRRSRAERAGPR